jgi:hypothetical protein
MVFEASAKGEKMIDESEREAAISHWNDIIENGVPVKTAHTCRGCGAVLAVCTTHTNYQDFKRCQESLKALCSQCSSWPADDSARADAR